MKTDTNATFTYKDTTVWIDRYHTGMLPTTRTCFCCGKKINNCNAALLINNQKHIPNTLLHETCFAEWEKKPEELCKDIESAYEQYQKLKAVFGRPE